MVDLGAVDEGRTKEECGFVVECSCCGGLRGQKERSCSLPIQSRREWREILNVREALFPSSASFRTTPAERRQLG